MTKAKAEAAAISLTGKLPGVLNESVAKRKLPAAPTSRVLPGEGRGRQFNPARQHRARPPSGQEKANRSGRLAVAPGAPRRGPAPRRGGCR